MMTMNLKMNSRHNAHLSIEGIKPAHESNDEIEQNEGGDIPHNTCQYRQ